ncbi:GntR family transcriptional regulator [Streptomyces sp. NPDC087917]|uniref:GntR family transcriptional regulator n=1 Tax=Streptomyces sp. NPDC087917 TaxID=3155060 RepID=UPI00344AE023
MTLPADDELLDRRALHARIAADLRDEIMSGDLPPGAKLPSTVRLKVRFGASSATVQKALQLLKDERLVVGRAGAAVTVRENRQRTIRPASSLTPAATAAAYPWLSEASRHGSTAHSILLAVAEVAPPADVATALTLDEGEPAFLRRQLLHIDDEPAELVCSYYPPLIARGTPLAEFVKIKGGTPTLLTQLGHPPRRSVDRVAARIPTQEQCHALRLPSDMPVLRTLRTVFGDDDRPVEATVMVKAGHLYELQYEFVPRRPRP